MEKTNSTQGHSAAEHLRIENSALTVLIIGTLMVFGAGFMSAYSSQSYFLLKLLAIEITLCGVIV